MKKRKESLSPLLPYRLIMNSDQRRLKGCFVQITSICDTLNMQGTKEDLLNIEARIKYQLINCYEDKKCELIRQGLYPKKGKYNQRRLTREFNKLKEASQNEQ